MIGTALVGEDIGPLCKTTISTGGWKSKVNNAGAGDGSLGYKALAYTVA